MERNNIVGTFTAVDLSTGVNIGMESYKISEDESSINFSSTANIFGMTGFSQKITGQFTKGWISESLVVRLIDGVEIKVERASWPS